MKLQLFAIVTIVTTVIALPTLEVTNTYEKRAVKHCDSTTLNKRCDFLSDEGEFLMGFCKDVSSTRP